MIAPGRSRAESGHRGPNGSVIPERPRIVVFRPGDNTPVYDTDPDLTLPAGLN